MCPFGFQSTHRGAFLSERARNFKKRGPAVLIPTNAILEGRDRDEIPKKYLSAVTRRREGHAEANGSRCKPRIFGNSDAVVLSAYVSHCPIRSRQSCL
jgi:hypothetical protein